MAIAKALNRCHHCGLELNMDGLCPACMLERGVFEPSDESDSRMVSSFGDYEIIEEIARGGMGVVYKARQISLNRLVAIKMVIAGRLAKKADLERFRLEAETVAQLRHPNIVAIHQVGEFEGQPYFAMDYIAGQSLAELANNKPLPARLAAGYVKSVAETVHFAHSKGVLHRDLKPSNILIDENNTPRVTDFGLAKRLDEIGASTSNAPLTLTGQVLGSPNFMAPEQAVSNRKDIGSTSDVYSLGAVLYQLLTGRPPFLAETLSTTLRLVAETEPPSPRLLNPGIHRDLETICLKCLQKEARARYPTALSLSEDLGRFLKNEPVLARPTSKLERGLRWCRRHPAVAFLGAMVFVLLLIIAIVSSLSVARLEQANSVGQEKLWNSYLSEARAKRLSGRPGRRFESLEAIAKAAAIRPSLELRNEAIASLPLTDLRPIKDWETVLSTVFVFDGPCERYARSDTNGEIAICSVKNDVEQLRIKNFDIPIRDLGFSPDGEYLSIVSGTNSHLKIYSLISARVSLELTNVLVSDFSPDSHRQSVAVVQRPTESKDLLCIYDFETGRRINCFTNVGYLCAIKLSPKGEFLATIADSDNSEVQIYDLKNGQVEKKLVHSTSIKALDWHPSRQELAVVGDDGLIQLWDLSSTKPTRTTLIHGGVVTLVRYNHDGTLLASLGWNDVLRIWNRDTGNLLLSASAIGYRNLGFSENSKQFVYWPSRYKMRLCELAANKECRSTCFGNSRQGVRLRAFSQDANFPTLASREKLMLWDEDAGREIAAIPEQGAIAITYDPQGKSIVTGGQNGLTRWPVTSERLGDLVRLELGPPQVFGPVGRVEAMFRIFKNQHMLVLIGHTVHVIDLATSAELRQFDVEEPAYFGRSRYGHWLASWKVNAETVRVWDVDTGKQVVELPAPLSFTMDFTPDNQILLTGSSDGYTAWHTDSWKPAYSIHRPDTGDAHGIMAFNADGSVGAVTYGRDSLRLFNPKTGAELATLEPPEPSEILGLTFDWEGSKLYVASSETGTHIWDLRLIRQELASMNLDWSAPAIPPEIKKAARKWDVVFVKNPNTNLFDLTSYFNCSFRSENAPESDVRSLPVGLQMFAGTTFDVRGREVGLGGGNWPNEITGIEFGHPCHSLNFLHAASSCVGAGHVELGEYVIHYQDGETRHARLVNDENIADWWDASPEPHPLSTNTVVAWRGQNPASRKANCFIQLYKFHWDNPRPEIPIASVDIRSTDQRFPLAIVAITAE